MIEILIGNNTDLDRAERRIWYTNLVQIIEDFQKPIPQNDLENYVILYYLVGIITEK